MPAGPGQPGQFKADRPNQLWVSDFTYVSTWQGWQYVAFVIDVYARRIVGLRQSSSMRTDFVLDALEQALYDRQPERTDALIHHSDRGSQYVSIRYSERLAEAGIEPSVGSRGGVDPISRTPYGSCRRSPKCPNRTPPSRLIRRSFVSR